VNKDRDSSLTARIKIETEKTLGFVSSALSCNDGRLKKRSRDKTELFLLKERK